MEKFDAKWWHQIAVGLGYDDWSEDEVLEFLQDPIYDSDDPHYHLGLWAEFFSEAVRRVLKTEYGIDALVWYFIEVEPSDALYLVNLIVIDRKTAKVLSVFDESDRVPKTPDEINRVCFTLSFHDSLDMATVNSKLQWIVDHSAKVAGSTLNCRP